MTRLRSLLNRQRVTAALVTAGLLTGGGAAARGIEARPITGHGVSGRHEFAQADQDPGIVVSSVTLGRPSVAVSGLNVVPVRVTAHKIMTTAPRPDDPTKDTIFVILSRTAGDEPDGAPGSRVVELSLISGTPRNGTYAGTTTIASTMNGTYAVTKAYAWLDSWGGMDPPPYRLDGPSLRVTGTHIPKLSLSTSPRPVPIGAPRYRLTGSLVDRDTGKGYGRPIRVDIGIDNVCVEYYPSMSVFADRTTGRFAIGLTRADLSLHCAMVSPTRNRDNITVIKGYFPETLTWVTAKPARTRTRVGSPVTVTGVVGGAPSCRVVLQRRLSTGWAQVGSAAIRPGSGRYTLYTRPTRVGAQTYRVSFPRCYEWWPVTSRTFVIRGV